MNIYHIFIFCPVSILLLLNMYYNNWGNPNILNEIHLFFHNLKYNQMHFQRGLLKAQNQISLYTYKEIIKVSNTVRESPFTNY